MTSSPSPPSSGSREPDRSPSEEDRGSTWDTVAEFTLSSEPGNERLAMERVARAVRKLQLPGTRLECLKTAVAEATLNAMEHGNDYRPELPVLIEVRRSPAALAVRITDQGRGGQTIPDPATPDLQAKLSGEQAPRGWGLFLIKNMVDELHVVSDEGHHSVELIVYRKEGQDGRHTA